MLRGMVVDDTLSNLTSTVSNEASISSSNNNRNEFAANLYNQQQQPIQSLASPNNQTAALQQQQQQQPPPKKKRSLPGHPDPDAEVVALSPTALMATNRFVCEICNKGFQRDQNLQLHRRGHNLPWKLKQRNNKEVVKKKVFVCPEPSCVHHDPSRALGDLTGIKKHFSRKHGEKKWKCDKCSKRYAVQSDWKAHSKICGTREYRCDCGTLFSRRDSFITHRAFCDALAEESSRSMTHHTPLLSSQTLINVIPPNSHSHSQIHGFLNHPLIPNLKQEISCQSTFNLPPWLSSSDQSITAGSNPLFSSIQENPNPTNPNFPSAAANSSSSSLMSATALLQKASQMGVTMSSKIGCQSSSEESILMRPHHHVGAQTGVLCAPSSTTTAVLPSREAFLQSGLATFGNNKQIVNVPAGCMDLQDINIIGSSSAAAAVNASASTIGFDHGSFSFEDTFNGMMNQKRNINPLQESSQLMGEGLTRDFLGLRAFPTHRNFQLDMDALDQMGSSSYDQQPPWQT